MLEFLESNYQIAIAISTISAVIISLCALIVSISSVYLARASIRHQERHNSLSVRPLPYITVGDYENALFIKIRNNGNGPLIIHELKIKGAQKSASRLIDLMPQLANGILWAHFTSDLSKRSIKAGDELVLLDLKGDRDNQAFIKSRNDARRSLSSLILALDYTDIYENQFPLWKRDLTWFGRNL
jgi:hypothetical protein